MKILAIRGKNLASLEGEFEVDFTTEPLKSAGIFAITGSTGSGKSTLLDAICLALFNDTPRFNHATDNADIVDVKSLTIKQKDSRSILRRGTADGYAEVDFISLAGERFRARWSVRRSRDKVDGSLQNTTYKVFNLTSGSELQGGKTELLVKVKELIGLTFEQFTRAVLLAQGDFATFLKAAPREKAELLEKLTGTDIYSRISSKIYENAKQAEAQLALITERIKDVELLSEEQITELTAEKESTTQALTALEAEVKVLTGQLQWLQSNEQLAAGVVTAQTELEGCQAAIGQAQLRFDYLARIESVQQIRDPFKQLESDQKLLTGHETSLQVQQELYASNQVQLEEVKKQLATLQTKQEELDAQWKQTEPQVKEARKLDVQVEAVAKNRTESRKELSQVTDQQAVCGKNITGWQQEIASIENAQAEIARWFGQYEGYRELVNKIDLVNSYITNIQSASKQITGNERLLNTAHELLDKEQESLNTQQAEAQRLNEILPAEIAALRAKLVENKPCPVCGSTHHPIGHIDVDSLEERALNEAKEIVAKDIKRLTESMANRKSEIIRLQALISGYKEQNEMTLASLSDLLSFIPEWNIDTIGGQLKQFVEQWKKNSTTQATLAEQLTARSQQLQTARQRSEELAADFLEKQTKYTSITSEWEQLTSARSKLLDGRKADEVENMHLQAIQTNRILITQTTEKQHTLIAKGEKTAGELAQLSEHILRLKSHIGQLERTVSEWLLQRTDGLRPEELTELLAKENAWIVAERAALDQLRKKEVSAGSVLAERKRMWAEHQKAAIRPTEEETKEVLATALNEKTRVVTQKRERMTEVTVLFANHEKGKQRIKQFEKELQEKSAIAENWEKLNELFGSADGAKFKVLAQGYTLDVLLGYANKHLGELTQRYKLERVSADSLSLQVVDLDMLSEVRSVHSLSGGESFLISLALALGLSSLSSNRMRVESLFIDEGFGSLDADTLRVAMDALERLQTQGRKIGVISHVAEMTERIPVQIRVIKSSNGKSHIEIV